MSDILKELEPNNVFHFFEEVCSIPRGSGNTKLISDYCVRFAKDRNLEYYQDDLNNVIIIKEASAGREHDEGVIIQGHLDMVTEKKPEYECDLLSQGLSLIIDGDYVYANGTTLGADDGIAIAYALAILDDSSISHPRLEVIFTVDEEIGMLGAAYIDMSRIKGKYLINIDSDEEDMLISGCAGGMTAICKFPLHYSDGKGLKIKLKVTGLKGGHSGMEIDKERGNANILLGRLLYQLQDQMNFDLESIQGGFKDNAIPREANAFIIIEDSNRSILLETISKMNVSFKKEYQISDSDVIIIYEEEESGDFKIICKEDREKIIFFLMNCPNGILHRNQSNSNLIETSLNLGILKISNNEVEFTFSVRSSVKERKQALGDKLFALISQLGGSYEIRGNYPEWEYNPESKLLSIMINLNKIMYDKESEVKTIHAGLECGYLLEKSPKLDIVSFGPNIYDIHTTEERLSISSVERIYYYLIELLKILK